MDESVTSARRRMNDDARRGVRSRAAFESIGAPSARAERARLAVARSRSDRP